MEPREGIGPSLPHYQCGVLPLSLRRHTLFPKSEKTGAQFKKLNYASPPLAFTKQETLPCCSNTLSQERELNHEWNATGCHDKIGAACRCCPDASSLENSHATVTSIPQNWSIVWELNPRSQLGRLEHGHYANDAFLLSLSPLLILATNGTVFISIPPYTISLRLD